MSTRAIVKSVLSGDTLIVRPKEAPERGKPAKERLLHIASISAPRIGSASREDEPFAYASREYLRNLVIGKEVAFGVTRTLDASAPKTAAPGAAQDREYASVYIAPAGPGLPPQDLAGLIVSAGWAKVRESGGEGDEAIRRLGAEEAKRRETLRAQEAQAKAEGKGLWSEEPESQRTVSFQMPADPLAFIAEHKNKEIDAIVEQVRDGTQLRVRLLLDENNHQFINLVVAGVKSPRASVIRDGDTVAAEPWGEEAKYFTEIRLLQRHIKVRLLSAPASLGASPFATAPTPATSSGLPGLPAPSGGASFIIGTALHPNGYISEFLAGAGLAKVIDWHAGILAPYGGLDKLRAAEKSAKEKRIGLWEGYGAPSKVTNGGANSAGANGAASTTKGSSFDAVVVRVWGPDQLSIVTKGDESANKERRVQLASVRGPRGADSKQSYWANEAKEFLRKRLIGKTVHVLVDYVKPKEGEFEERECVTITYGGSNSNISEQLIEKGLATVLRHKRDDEDRSAELDKLVVAEQTAVTELRGLHSTKEVTLPRIVDASENSNRAAQYLPSWKRAGRIPAVVEFVSSGSRFKVFLPKENAKITFILAGIRAPRAARGPGEKSEPFGNEALKFSSKFMQRDVELVFDSTDKQGGFVGTMYLGNTNVGVDLVREGLAQVHEFSATKLPYGRQLLEAEESSKKERKNIWINYDGEEEQSVETTGEATALAPEYLDVYISSVRDTEPFTFSVQILDSKSVADLERLMTDFASYHRTAAAQSPPGFSPKTGDLVSAKFSEDNQWYRARVKRSSAIKKEATLSFIDYGNEEVLPFSSIRPIGDKFKSLPGQAKDARLSFVKLVPKENEYGFEARRKFNSLTAGKKLIANVDHREGGSGGQQLLHLRLIDPSDPNAAHDPLACLNADIVREGLALIDKSCRYLNAYPQVLKKIQSALEGAKADRLGMFEYGDVSED